MNIDRIATGQRIRALRAGKSLPTAAAAAQVIAGDWYRLETGRGFPHKVLLEQIAKSFDMSLDELVIEVTDETA